MSAQNPSLQRAVASYAQPLLYRPLMGLVGAAVVGVAMGGVWAQLFAFSSRENAPWWIPLVFVILGAAVAWKNRDKRWIWRAGFAVAVAGFFASHTFRRVLAPGDDVSWLCAVQTDARLGPIPEIAGRARGIVADYPQISEFSVAFPLLISSWNGQRARGKIWVVAPFDSVLGVGDEISLDLSLFPLARPTNPGERATFWSHIGGGCWCEGRKIRNLAVLKRGAAFPVAQRIETLRRAIYDNLEAGFARDSTLARPFPAQNAALLTAMVFGESGLPHPLARRVRDDFRAAGLSHLLVASGTQVTFVAACLLLVASHLALGRWKMVLFVVPGLVLYAAIAGSAPSIWRATALGFCAAWALGSGRDLDGLAAWSAALLALLLIDPLGAWSLSTQLTFAATWGLICLSPLFFRALKAWGEGFWIQLAALSLGAQLAVVPVTLFHFGTANIAGIGANFFAVPLAGALVLLGTLDLFLPLEWLTYHLTRAVGFVAVFGANLPGAQAGAPGLKLVWSWACYALFLGALLPNGEGFEEFKRGFQQTLNARLETLRRLNPWPICALLLCFGAGATAWHFWPRPQKIRVTVFDVGQGEAILLQVPGGAALIDGGSLDERGRADIGDSVIVPALSALGVEKLDYLILSHADADHCNGLSSVAREVPIRAFLDGVAAAEGQKLKIDPTEVDYLRLRRELTRQGVPTIAPRAGQTFQLGAAKLQILAPSEPFFDDRNNNCLVFRLEWRQQKILFTGDMESASEERLVHSKADLSATILKVGHHGSKTSSSPEFLKAVGAGAAVISCGRFNRFGHPSAQTLDNLTSQKMAIFRTDLDGALSVECDEKSCAVAPER